MGKCVSMKEEIDLSDCRQLYSLLGNTWNFEVVLDA